jgi:LacI family transcriptional regulator
LDLVRYIRERSRHVIQCSGSANPEETPVVSLDDFAAGEVAANHLLDCRLEHFAYYGRRPGLTSGNRHKGFAAALAARGYACVESPVDWPVESDRPRDSHWPQLIDFLRSLPKPVGILAMDDSAAHDLAAACLKAELSVPDRVAIIGVNNDDLMCESAWPPLSSVEGDFSRIGFVAAGLMDRLLNGQTLKPQERHVRLPPLGVVPRVSTDVLAVDDPNLAEAVRYVREHACDPCTVHDMLRHVPVGRRWLERQFVAKLGRSPHDEILRVRMDTARRLLLRNDLSLPDVANRCGFSAVASFTRAFTQSQGVAPGGYRRTARRTSPA